MLVVMTRTGHNGFQTVHLPDVPGYDVGSPEYRSLGSPFAKELLMILVEGGKQGFTCKEQIVALPLIAIHAAQCQQCPMRPFFVRRVIVHQAQLAVEDTCSLSDRDRLTRNRVIARG